MALAISYRTELEELRSGFGLTERELASALSTTPRTLRRWLADTAVPRHQARERIEDLLDVLRTLRTSVRAAAIPKWVRRRVVLLDDERPAEVMAKGDVERLRRVAEALSSGSVA